ncbi:MAG: polysaccharide deacetylase family protein [Bacteroidales bacterium]|nr:polysaccharide deacetylase family protein [Bacteroidales bacterium]
MKRFIFFCSSLGLASLCACNSIDPDNHQCEVATWGHFADAAISYTFDDNLPNQFTIAVPMLEKYNFRGTFYPIINNVDDWQILQNMAANGHEIGSHTMSHPALGSLSPDSLEYELSESCSFINQNIPDSKCLSIAYPYCNMPDTTAVYRNYIAARICDNRIEGTTPRSFCAISSFGLGCESSQYHSIDSVIGIFDRTKVAGGWSSLLIHEIGEGNGYSPISVADLDSTMSYLDNNKSSFWVAPFIDVVKYISERGISKISLIDQTDDSITLTFSCTLDPLVYNFPLDIRRPLPAGWSGAVVTQYDNKEQIDVPSSINNGYIYFSVVPSANVIVIKRD